MGEIDKSKFWWGFLPGIILPPIFMVVYFFFNVKADIRYWDFLLRMVEERIFPALLAVSGIVNLLIFYYFMHKEQWMAGRGVILATMIFALVMLGFKFL